MANYFDQYDEPKGATPKPQRYRGGYKPKSDEVQGFMSAMQGPTFGFLDEAVGGLSALGKIPQGADAMAQRYRDARDAVRANVEDYEGNYPTLAVLSRVAASAPTAVMLPGFKLGGLAASPTSSRAAVMGANMLRAGLTAGTYGAINAAGNSEYDDGMGMLGDIALGGASSAAMGGILPPAASVMGGGVRRIATSPLNPMRDKAALSFAERKVAEALIRDLPTDANVMNPAARSLAYQKWLGQGGRIVDVGDDASRGLLDVTANLPGRAGRAVTKAVEERVATRGGQMVAAADKALGTGGAELRGSLQALEASRRAAATPLYNQLRSMEIQVTPSLSGALAAADDLGALALGRKSATANQAQFTLSGPPAVGSKVSMSDLDYAKRGLDALIEGQIGPTGKLSSLGRDYMSLRSALVDELDNATIDPATGQSIYNAARAAWAGPSRMAELANLGRNIFGKDKNWSMQEAIQGATASELAAIRLGVVQAVKDKAGTQSGQTWLINNWKNPAHRDAIRLAFGDDSRAFLSSLQKFGKMKKLEQVGATNSATFRREAAAEDLGMEPVQDLARAAAAAKTGNLAGITDYVGKMANRLNVPEPVRNQIAKIMLMRGPEARAQLIKMGAMLEQLNRQQAAQAQAAGQFVGRINPWLMPEGQ